MFAELTYHSGGQALQWFVLEARPRWPGTRDREAFWAAVEAVTTADPRARRLGRRIARQEQRLAACASPAAWKEFLALEEATSARTLVWLEAVARWAHAAAPRQKKRR